MSLSHLNIHGCSISPVLSAPSISKLEKGKNNILHFEDSKERIRKMFNKVEISVSSYDTAWVAMVPSLNSPHAPHFPECINWLLDNQLPDGSWSLPRHHPLLIKDVLMSTLACVIALKRWGVGERQMNRGIQFVESNISSVTDEKQYTPIGFDIIFPGMIELAKDLNLNLLQTSIDLDKMLQRRYVEVRRSNAEGQKAFLAYVSEGIGKLQDWEMVMEYQRKNGSLFNSPSTTAAACCHIRNAGCLQYLRSLVEKFGNAVPTVYPRDLHARLRMVDTLERLGIDRHFMMEIETVLEETYRCWMQGEEDIFLDTTTCALAFRLLRANGFDVSSDPLAQFAEEAQFFNSLGGYLKDIGSTLELYRASQMIIYPDELNLEKQNAWTSHFLKQALSNNSTHTTKLNDNHLHHEVDDAIKFPYHATLERMANRKYMELYCADNIKILKTSYCSNIGNKDFIKLALEDFSICQSIHNEELKHLERWVAESRLGNLDFFTSRLKLSMAYCYFSAAATMFTPELSDARMSWTKHGVLTTILDDFFDITGSQEELLNLITLVEKWDVNNSTDFCSERVKIMFTALKSTICESGDKAFASQGRDVTGHVIEIWLDVLKTFLREAEWSRFNIVPTLDEYMSNGYVSFALGPIVLPTAYLVGHRLSEEMIRSVEYHNLFKLMSTCSRLLNDIQGFKREIEQGKLNAVSLLMIDSNHVVTEEEAIAKIRGIIDCNRRELLRLVLQEKGSIVPRASKDLFWKMSKICHLFYMTNDGYRVKEMISTVNSVIYDPILKNYE